MKENGIVEKTNNSIISTTLLKDAKKEFREDIDDPPGTVFEETIQVQVQFDTHMHLCCYRFFFLTVFHVYSVDLFVIRLEIDTQLA